MPKRYQLIRLVHRPKQLEDQGQVLKVYDDLYVQSSIRTQLKPCKSKGEILCIQDSDSSTLDNLNMLRQTRSSKVGTCSLRLFTRLFKLRLKMNGIQSNTFRVFLRITQIRVGKENWTAVKGLPAVELIHPSVKVFWILHAVAQTITDWPNSALNIV